MYVATEMEDPETAQRDPRAVLIARAREGDRAAADALLRPLVPRIRNLVRYLVRGDSEVDDIAQLAMVAILRGLPGFRAEGAFLAWVDRIVVREAISQAKRGRRERAQRADAAPELRVVGGDTSLAERYENRREAARLLDALPPEQRQAIVLHHVAGMSVPEVADALGLPFDTVKSRMRLGMKKLRAAHAAEGGRA